MDHRGSARLVSVRAPRGTRTWVAPPGRRLRRRVKLTSRAGPPGPPLLPPAVPGGPVTAVAPKPIAPEYPARQTPKGSTFLKMLRTTDPKDIAILYLVTSFGF